ncbi:dihydroorotate dehydrogenase [Falsiroseomonas selenitidurans]|uniref:Dihydroorotate dehydrogenase n=1 Tax=Falsiroseomonas selenitidurans TaxID=2716335 RepID=A0ABX1DYD2_9PROT|nr:dihydroorotate dehydrogenase [Falsiroseomonas selenitidurans]NKC29871.1 dihydroorotate dehydrogenase [Falsiroseomonas selenitidurans]
MVDLSVRIGGLALANPVMPASGTFGPELAQVFDLNRLGALVTKSVTPQYRQGNALPRLCETEAGVLNSIGIPGKGLDHFCTQAMAEWRRFTPPLVVSLSADTVAAFADAAARLAATPGVAAIEANISCPNLEEDGRAFAMHPESAAAAIAAMRAACALPLWAKLSPNTADIAAVARAVEEAGADAVVVANTILGLAIDIERMVPKLGAGMGGFSGPAFKPIALRLVWQCAQAVRIPVIGVGGIATPADAVEFLMAGASAVQVGTASFVSPTALPAVLDGLAAFCARRGFARVSDLTGLALPGRLRPAAE